MIGLRSIVGLSRESLRGVSPGEIDEPLPEFTWIDPRKLYVEESYQRTVGEAGIGMIRNIYSAFSWSRYKPPICVRMLDAEGVLVVIDGQHTAIAAASHPRLREIPIMIVSAADAEQRAGAFVGHNRDRVGLTPQMIYRAELAAGDEVAAGVDRVCKASGAFILEKAISLRDKYPVGATVAIGTLKVLIKRRGEEEVIDALKVLVAAARGPIKADEISATARVLDDFSYGTHSKRLVELIRTKTPEAWSALGAAVCVEKGGRLSAGIAEVWSRELRARLKERRSTPPAPEPESEKLKIMSAPAPKPPPAPPKPKPKVEAQFKPAPRPSYVPPPPPKAEPIKAEIVERAGIRFDTATGELQHAGSKTRIADRETVAALALLIKVSPSLLDEERVAEKAFGRSADGRIRLRALVEAANPILAQVKLKIRSLKNIGTGISPL